MLNKSHDNICDPLLHDLEIRSGAGYQDSLLVTMIEPLIQRDEFIEQVYPE